MNKDIQKISNDTITKICNYLESQDVPYGIKTETSSTRGVLYYRAGFSYDIIVDVSDDGVITINVYTYPGITASPNNIQLVCRYCGSLRPEIGVVLVALDTGTVYYKASTIAANQIDINTIKAIEACSIDTLNIHSASLNRIAHGIVIAEDYLSKEYREWIHPGIRKINDKETSIYNNNISLLHDLIPKTKKYTSLIHNQFDTCDYFVGDSIDLLVNASDKTHKQKYRSVIIARADRKHGFLRVYSVPHAGILGDSSHRYDDVFELAAKLSLEHKTIVFTGDSPLNHGHCAYIDISLMTPLDENVLSNAIIDLCRAELSNRTAFDRVANGLPEIIEQSKKSESNQPPNTDIATMKQLREAVSAKVADILLEENDTDTTKTMDLIGAKKTQLC